jgi:hypothetical protein
MLDAASLRRKVVTPAKAGIQYPESSTHALWTPACAGVTPSLWTPAPAFALALLHKSPAFPTRRVRMRIAQRF